MRVLPSGPVCYVFTGPRASRQVSKFVQVRARVPRSGALVQSCDYAKP